MVQRKYLAILCVLASSIVSASPWLPAAGKYHYYNFYEKTNIVYYKVFSELYATEQKLYLARLDVQQEAEKVSKNTRVPEHYIKARLEALKQDINSLNTQVRNLSQANYYHPSSNSMALEYGYNDRYGGGIKLHHSSVASYGQSRTQYNELEVFGKIAILRKDSYIMSLQPKVMISNKTHLGFGLLVGKASVIGHLRNTEVKFLDNVEIFIDDIKQINKYKLQNTIGLELGRRVWFLYDVNYSESRKVSKANMLQSLRHKISIACKIGKGSMKPVIHTSYFRDYWIVKTSHYSGMFKVGDGIGFGIWMNF